MGNCFIYDLLLLRPRLQSLHGDTGTEYFDMVAYEKFHDGKMDNYIPTDEEIAESLPKLPIVEQ